MPVDQRPDEEASAVITGPVLDREMEVTGMPRVRLRFSSTATRMGVIVKLCDVAPDGTVALVTRGYLNVAHRNGTRRPERLAPATEYDLAIEMKATSYVFEPGHRVRLAVTSAEFPSVWPTPETGSNTLHFGPERGCFLDLPVVAEPPEPPGPGALRVLPPTSPGEPEDRTFTVTRDGASGEARADFRARETFRAIGATVEHVNHTWATVRRDRPAEAVAEAEASFRFACESGERIESTGRVRCDGHEESVLVRASIAVTVDGRPFANREWSFLHPRDFI